MKLSIITINYNNAEGLEKTIKSVISQSYNDFEYIVIDGGSTDGSKEIIESYSDKISYWVSEPDKGIYNAMNKGINHAKGEYLLFMNSGDILNLDTNLKDIEKDLESGEDIIYYDMVLVDGKNNRSFVKKYADNADFLYLMVDTIPHQASFIKRKVLVDYGGYDEKWDIISDWTFFIDAICLNNASYKHVPKAISSFNLDGISSQVDNIGRFMVEREEHIKTYYPAFLRLFQEWKSQRDELNRIRSSRSYKIFRKIKRICHIR